MDTIKQSLSQKKENNESLNWSKEIEKEKVGKKIFFKVKSRNRTKDVAVAKVEIAGQGDGGNIFYKLKDINSSRKGAGSYLLQKVNEFVEQSNGSISASVRLENVSRFQKAGWMTLGSGGSTSVTMVYNMDNVE